jgi:hypothetical protein
LVVFGSGTNWKESRQGERTAATAAGRLRTVARPVPKSLLEVLPGPGVLEVQTGSRHDVDGRNDVDLLEGSAGTGGTDAHDGAPTRRRRRLPRWWLAVAAVVVATAVALPVRSTVAVNELHRLDNRWAWYEALDGQRTHLEARLADGAQDPTDRRVLQGRAALDAEEGALLRQARTALLAGRHLPDAGVNRLRQAMALAFADQATDLQGGKATGVAPQQAPIETQPATSAAIFRVVQLLNAELARWQQQPVRRPVAVGRLLAADRQLAELATPVDVPIAAGLVFVGPAGTVTTVNLDARLGEPSTRQLTLQLGNSMTGPVVSRGGWLAVNAEVSATETGLVYAVNPDLSGDPRVIGTTVANLVLPASEPSAVWLQTGAGAVEVDSNGTVLLGPVPISPGRTLVGVTDQLLVTNGLTALVPTTDLQMVPMRGANAGHATVLTANGQLLAAAAGHVAWVVRGVDGSSVIKLADGAARGARTFAPPVLTNVDPTPANLTVPRALPVDMGAFSPDGTTLVMRDLTVSHGASDVQLAVMDVASGVTKLIDGSVGDHPAGLMVWAPAGDRVFLTVARGSQAYIGMWQVGSPSPTAIRVPTPSLLALAATGR